LIAAALLLPAIRLSATDTGELPSLAGLYNDLGVLRALRNEWGQVREHLDSALRYDSQSSTILNNIGNYLVCQGQLDSATYYYERAIQRDSMQPAPLYNLAIASYLAGRTDDAVKQMSEALAYVDLDANLRSIIQLRLDALESEKGDPSKLTQLEIRQLLDAARARRDSALVRARTSSSPGDTTESSRPDSAAMYNMTPAGGKAAVPQEAAEQLYWITYGAGTRYESK